MAKKRAKSEEPKKTVKSEEPKKKKPISLNILEIAKRLQKLEETGGGGGSADSAKRSDIATEFNTETSYTAGNFVYYEGKLYQFNADHSAGAWDPTDVVEANVTDQIVSNASAIAGLTASDVTYDNTTSGLSATNVQGAMDELLGSVRFYTVDVPATAINSQWAGSIYYATIMLDAPETLTGKKVFISFERTTEPIVLGWTVRSMSNGTKIAFTMCRPDNQATIAGKLQIMVKD